MTLNLSEPVAAYFAAGHDPAALARCFAPHAVLQDDGHTHAGREAIVAFLAEAAARYGATTAPFAVAQEGGTQRVRATVTGNFPGSPIELGYRFRLERGLIASLEISA